MMDTSVRKSSRVRKRTSYAEDDFEYDFDIADTVPDIGESKTNLRKGNDGHTKKKKSSLTVSKKASKKSLAENKSINNNTEGSNFNFNHSLESVKTNEKGDSKTESSNHSSSKLGSGSLFCPLCTKHLTSVDDMTAHMLQHQKEGGNLKGCFVCDKCNQICMDQASYNRHMKSHSSDRKHKCEICEKTFVDSCSLKRHMRTHADDRPYACDLCFKTFRDNPSLLRHERTHTDRPRVYQCLKCDKNFADKHGLKRHDRIHTGVRPFECKVCSKTFSESGSFKRHLKIHTGVRSHACPVCNKTFLEKQSLVRHQRNVCGFGNASFFHSGGSQLNSFDLDSSRDSFYSGGDYSEMSHKSFEEGGSKFQKDTPSSGHFSVFDTMSLIAKARNFMSPPVSSNSTLKISKVGTKGAVSLKDAPSLHSLMKKDPNLYNSISGLVDSIDSYEKMLDLCGDRGQKAIEAALTLDPVAMPDNLLCFECGELLVDGENFKSEGKNFHPSLKNSFRCLTCDEEDDEDYGDPPILTAEVPVNSPPPGNEKISVKEESEFWKDNLRRKAQEDELNHLPENIRNAFGHDESLEHLRERLKAQHGVYFIGDEFGQKRNKLDYESDTNDQSSITSYNATASCSNSTDSDKSAIPNLQAFTKIMSQKISSKRYKSVTNISAITTQQNFKTECSSLSNQNTLHAPPIIQSKLEYEADDPNIPSVFPCHLCTKVFATSAFLEQHLDLHRKSPHKCMVCGKTFTNSPGLRRHMTIHTGKKPYSCHHCGKAFRDPSNCSKHRKACLAAISAPSPANSISSNSASSPLSVDEPHPSSRFKAKKAGGKSKASFQTPKSSATPRSSNHLLKFSYDDEDEDLPLTFGFQVHNAQEDYSIDQNNKTSVLETPQVDPSDQIKESEDEEEPMLLPCSICGKTFRNKEFLDLHMNYHNNPDVACIECGKSFADPHSLKRHARIHAGSRPHICEYCNRGYCDNWSLKKHKSRGCILTELKVPTDSLRPCPQCNRVFTEVRHLQDHMKNHKGLLKFECDICMKRFSEAFNLKRHRRLHMAVCPGCEREFKDIQSLADHQATECTGNASQAAADKIDGYPCPECGRVYSSKAYLERHKKFHSDLKPHACEICGKRFSEAFKLRRHLKVHSDTKPYTCNGCGKGFANGMGLRRHMASSACHAFIALQKATGPQDFPCHLCDKVFLKNYLLVRHMNVHSQERPFSCETCGKSYKDTSSLKRHTLVHQGIKDFICSICGKDFFYADSLKRHMNGACSKKKKSHRPSKFKPKKKSNISNNNIAMKNNNTVVGGDTGLAPKIRKLSEDSTSTRQSTASPLLNKGACSVQLSSRNVRGGTWSCHTKNHCWKCDLKLSSPSALFTHARIHKHKKPYQCCQCFFRCSRKLYWKLHIKSHQSSLSLPITVEKQEPEEPQRPRRSVPRAHWSWLSQI